MDLNVLGIATCKRSYERYIKDCNWHHMRAPDGTPLARKRKGRGGGFEFCTSLLPVGVRAIAERKYAYKAETTLQTETQSVAVSNTHEVLKTSTPDVQEVENACGLESPTVPDAPEAESTHCMGAFASPNTVSASDTRGLVGGASPERTPLDCDINQLWEDYDKLNGNRKETAQKRLHAVIEFTELKESGMSSKEAEKVIANKHNIARSALYRHLGAVKQHDRRDWLAVLAPQVKERRKIKISQMFNEDMWEHFKTLYLRPEKPTYVACYRHLQQIAVSKDWGELPPEYQLRRKLQAEVPYNVQVLLRDGEKSLEAMYPAMERTREGIEALDIVNFDGHTWDVFVRDTDGKIFRPIMTAVQDIYSGKLLAWRFSRSADKYTTQLVVADMVKDYGVPKAAVFDNGRDFTSKMITGGTPHRFRNKVKEDEPTGVIVALGCKVHFTLPYSGKSKPIERVFRDFAGDIAKHPTFAGAYVGNTPLAKPDNYGNSAVDFDEFVETVNGEIARWNARTGRTGGILNGRSCDQAFKESYESSTIKRATESQMRMCLLAGEPVRVSRKGTVKIMETEYWNPWLSQHIGEKVVVRFDPENLHANVYIYALDSTYLGELEPKFKGQFIDAQAAQTHNRDRREYVKTTKTQAELAKKLGIDEVSESLRGKSAPEKEKLRPAATEIVNTKVNDAEQNRASTTKETDGYDDDKVLDFAMAGMQKMLKDA